MLKLTPNRAFDPKPRIPDALRKVAHRRSCEVCQRTYGTNFPDTLYQPLREALDHFFPRTWLRKFGLQPHVLINLVSCCQKCHGAKLRAENRLFNADAISYVQELRRLNYPLDRLKVAAQFYGLSEVVKLLDV